jgi:DNA-binding LacI/PurR family transcriptional regulator
MNLRSELSDIFHERTNYDFVGPKKRWFAISATFILIGLAALGIRGGLNLGIDFKGGTSWEVKTQGIKPTTAGARDAMQAAGLDAGAVAEGGFNYASGVEAAERLLPGRPSAIFAANDEMAIGVLTAARRAGLAVPDDLSVAGLDDAPSAHYCSPTLTTVHQPTREMGQRAADLLIDLVERRA